MLERQNCILLIIDVQQKLAPVMHSKESLLDNLRRLVMGIKVLGVPVLLTEQYPEGLGRTVPELATLLPEVQPIWKQCFDSNCEELFVSKLKAAGRQQVIICGIESHVCVYQTAMGLLRAGYQVHVVSDAVSSRTAENRQIGLDLMRQAGAVITGTETVLFELLRVAKGDEFKAISRIVK